MRATLVVLKTGVRGAAATARKKGDSVSGLHGNLRDEHKLERPLMEADVPIKHGSVTSIFPDFVNSFDRHDYSKGLTEEQKKMFVEGDYAQIKKGKNVGFIGRIRQLSADRGNFLFENMETFDTENTIIPKEAWFFADLKHYVNRIPIPIPIANARLVAYLPDEKKGGIKRVAIDRVQIKGSRYDAGQRQVMPVRHVFGRPDLVIPYPRVDFSEKAKSLSEGVSNGFRIVRRQTGFVASIHEPPIPPEALGDIRNPYSKHRSKPMPQWMIKKLQPIEMPQSESKLASIKERQERRALYEKLKTKPFGLERDPAVAKFLASRIADKLGVSVEE